MTQPQVEPRRPLQLCKHARAIFVFLVQVIDEEEAHHCYQCKEAISGLDLLALFLSARQIPNGRLKDACPALGELEDDFDLESKIVAPKRNGLQQDSVNSFVAGLHISEAEVGQPVAAGCEEFVDPGVPMHQCAPIWRG